MSGFLSQDSWWAVVRGSTAPTYIRRYFALALLHTTRRHRRHNERFTIHDHNKSRVQDSPVSTYTIKCNVHIKYNLSVSQLLRPQISSFGPLVQDHDNLTPPSLPPLNCPHYTASFGYFPIPTQSPSSYHSGSHYPTGCYPNIKYCP